MQIGTISLLYRALNTIFSPVTAFFNITDSAVDAYGKGMLNFYYEDGLGKRGDAVSMYSWADDIRALKVNTSDSSLIIQRSHILNGNKPIKYKLDGWTGRYGMPIEFLLAIHKATLKPDLAYDMATSFNTNVNILLKDISGEVMSGYKSGGKIITWDQVERVITSWNDTDLLGLGWVFNFFAKLHINEQRAIAMYDLGLDICANINCPTCQTEVLPIVTNQDFNEDNILSDDEKSPFAGQILKQYSDGNYYFTLDDNSYTDSGWAWLLGENDDDDDRDGNTSKSDAADEYGNGKYFVGDGDTDGDGVPDEDPDGVITPEEEAFMNQYTGDEKFIDEFTVVHKVCDSCLSKANSVSSLLQKNYDSNFSAYQPYIESVTDHWYRDVYFVKPDQIKFSDSQKEKYEDYYGGTSNINIVEQDYDYEAFMRERWTLYKTYDETDELAGNFIWYIIDKDGKYATSEQAVKDSIIDENAKEKLDSEKLKKDDEGFYYYYVADIDDAKEVGLAVSKKAVTMESGNTDFLEDLGWKSTDSVWSAYEVSPNPVQSGYETIASMYNSFEEFKAENPEDLANNMYINMITNGNIIQIGEGVRGETNPEIKKMFLQNRYFTYDGSTETAEIITALREEVYKQRDADEWFKTVQKYGPLSEEELELEYEFDINEDGENEKYRVKDYAATVMLEQDALNAFSMLENTHTLDADYIYRDFKELVVELGFYSKEELTEGVPRIMSFLIPEIGSAGYPERTIDKEEYPNKFKVTMIHSKYDIEANRKYTLKEVMNEKIGDLHEEPTAMIDKPANNVLLANANRVDNVSGITSRVNNDRLSLSANEINIQEVGEVKIAPKKPKQVPLDTFLKKTREMCAYMNMVGYDYCVYSEPGDGDYRGECTCPPECTDLYNTYGICYKQTGRIPSTKRGDGIVCTCPANHCKHDVHRNDVKRPGHWLAQTFEKSKEAYANNVCCDRLVKWALQNVGVIAQDGGVGGASSLGSYIMGIDGAKKINHGEDLEPGDILVSSSHIEIVGEKKKTGFVKYNGGHQVDVGATEPGDYSAIQFATQEKSWGWAEYAIRLPWAKSEVGVYEGYEGNEAVVSPVTGILLEYGTTIRRNVDQETMEMYEEEVNEDKGITPKEDDIIINTEPVDENSASEPINGRIVEEEVGYAKILVLNREYYTALEKKFISQFGSMKLYESDGKTPYKVKTQDELDTLSFEHETLLAYRDMMEDYEYFGIDGHTIVVEGFKLELPQENFDSDEDEHFDDETALPDGVDLTINDFRVSLSNIKNPGDKIQTGYEIPEEHKVASEKANEKQLVKELMKIDAAYAMEVTANEKPAIFIKEGTVLGRTFTDREMILSVRGEQLEDYMTPETIAGEEPDPEKGNLDKVIGNYIRIGMEDREKEDVENVEDYMKLDELDPREPNDWELFFWLPFESGACDDENNGGPECIGVCSVGETAVGIIQWTSLGTMNNIASFCKKCLEIDRNLCAPLAAFTGWSVNDFTNDIGTPGNIKYSTSQVKAALNQICETDRESFLSIQMDIAKEEYLDPLLEEYPWLETRPSCVQGAVMHLKVWGASTSWVGAYESASDEDIILQVRETIASTGSTAGPASNDPNSGRAYNEPQIALEILAGKVTTEEVEKWVREKDTSIFDFKFR